LRTCTQRLPPTRRLKREEAASRSATDRNFCVVLVKYNEMLLRASIRPFISWYRISTPSTMMSTLSTLSTLSTSPPPPPPPSFDKVDISNKEEFEHLLLAVDHTPLTSAQFARLTHRSKRLPQSSILLTRLYTRCKLSAQSSPGAPSFLLDARTYHNLIRASRTPCLTQNNLSAASFWYDHARDSSVELSLQTHNVMIDVAGKVGRFREAEKYFQQIEKSSMLNPNIVTWTSYLEAAGRRHHRDHGPTLLAEGTGAHAQADVVHRVVREILARVSDGRLYLTAATVSVMIDALCHCGSGDDNGGNDNGKRGLDTAARVFLSIPFFRRRAMATSGLEEERTLYARPTYNHWSSIVEGCCRHNDIDRAFTHIRWMKSGSAPWTPMEELVATSNTQRMVERIVQDRDHMLSRENFSKNPYMLCLTLLGKDTCNEKKEDARRRVRALYVDMEGNGEEAARKWRSLVLRAR